MLSEQQVRDRLAELQRDLTETRTAWLAATIGPRTASGDLQLLNGTITALESAIEELHIVLEESA